MSDTYTGLARRELWIDARDLQSDSDPDNPLTPEEYLSLLTARGVQKMAEHQLVKSFSTEIRTFNPTYEYGVDFFLGDIITATDERLGLTVNAVVQAAERTASRDGETMTLTLGFSMPTLHDILKRKAAK